MLCWLFGHKWKIVLDGSGPSYKECERCRTKDDGRLPSTGIAGTFREDYQAMLAAAPKPPI